MRTAIFSLSLFLFFATVISSQAQIQYVGEMMVQPGGSPVVATSTDSSVDNLAKIIAENQRSERSQKKIIKTSLDNLKKSNEVIAKGIGTAITETQGVGSKVENVRQQIAGSTWVLAGLIAIAFILLALGLGRVSRRNREHTTNEANRFVDRADTMTDSVNDMTDTVNRRADEVLAEVRSGFAEMRTGFTDLPARVATAVHTLDASPFEFETAGHLVTYQSPVEGITEGYYLLLHVPKDEVGTPETYIRGHEANRGVARRNCRKTMQRYFEGDFNTPEYKLQKDFIDYLVKTGEISFRTAP